VSFQEKSVLVALAGPVAEMIHSGAPDQPGFVAESAADWPLAWEAASPLMPLERQRLAYLERTTARNHLMLDQDAAWSAVAEQLLSHDTLEGEEIDDIVRRWIPLP
jgi:hypothetical protein